MSKRNSGEDHFETCSKKGRGMAQQSLDLIGAMYAAAKAAQPITGRGVVQTVRRRPDPFDGDEGNAARLSPAEISTRAGHHPVGMDRRRDART
jgi:hypothetical protein